MNLPTYFTSYFTTTFSGVFDSAHDYINNAIDDYKLERSAHPSLLKTLSSLLLYSGITLFIISLFFNVFFTNSDDISGIWILLMGWLGFIIFQFAWYANPLSLLAILLMKKRPVVAVLLSLLAVIVASGTFIFNEIPAASGNEKIYIKELGLGAYIWYASHWLILYAMVFNSLWKGKRGDES